MLTPLQWELRARTRGTLISIPIDDVGSQTPNRSSLLRLTVSTGVGSNPPMQTINDTATLTLSLREYTGNLAYSNLSCDNDSSGKRFDGGQAFDPS